MRTDSSVYYLTPAISALTMRMNAMVIFRDHLRAILDYLRDLPPTYLTDASLYPPTAETLPLVEDLRLVRRALDLLNRREQIPSSDPSAYGDSDERARLATDTQMLRLITNVSGT